MTAPDDMTWAEKVVVYTARSLTSRGVKAFRAMKRETGITPEEYAKAKASSIAKGFLNKRGAITPKGSNTVDDLSRFPSRPA